MFAFTAALPLILFLVDKLLVVVLPTDLSTKAEAIVVLGRGGGAFYDYRVNLAAKLWKAERAPLIFLSGNVDAPSMIEQLQAKGVPKQALDGENCSLTTAENAVFSAAVLQAQGIRQIILITDEPHMWRSLLVYRAHGFTVIPQTTPLPSYMSLKEKIFITVREFAGLVGYGLRGLYLKQTSPESTSPEIVDLVQKAQQYGKQRSLK